MIVAKALTKRYGDKDILVNTDFTLGNGKKVGLVGRNGCGKTTLLKILVGLEDPTSGSIQVTNEVLGYIPQEFSFPDELVGEYLEKKLSDNWEFYKVETLASKLKFHNFDIYQEIKTLSEGQKMKIKLIETLLKNPTTLFIDEPTNHLDIEGIQWFEEYIKNLDITVLMISHDRSFLNHTVDEIWEIEKCKILSFVGGYDNYKSEKLRLIDKWDAEYVRFLKKKTQLEKLLDNVHKIKGGKKRGSAVEAVKKRIAREIESDKKEKYVIKKVKDFKFDTDVRYGKLMIRFENVSKKFDRKTVFNNLNLELRGMEKVWLFGPNGSGKTTLVKILMGEEKVTSGSITIGENIKIGYFAQNQEYLKQNKDLLETFMGLTECDYGPAFGYLKKFLFDKDAIKKRLWQLSPGERARFAFAVFAHKNYDLLILDEPDNHLDIETKEVIEKSIAEFKGTLFLVSHDRYFVESVGITKVLNLKEGKLSFFNAGT